ncbi:MAG: hypothetical protein WCH31_06730 [Actinomycetes bacterium]
MNLVGQWDELVSALPARWTEARIELALEEARQTSRATGVLSPLQPFKGEIGAVAFRIARGGSGPSAGSARRLLGLLDAERIHGTLSLTSMDAAPLALDGDEGANLAASWATAIATLPGDWSDLLGEIELHSSDWFDLAAIHLGPLNPRRNGSGGSVMRFRSASRFGYGASPGMVVRCLERCDAAGIRGDVRILRVLSDSRPVGTQGPVWHIDGEMV